MTVQLQCRWARAGPPGGADQPRKQLDAWQDWAKQRGAKGLAYVLIGVDGELGGPVAKNLTDDERAGLAARVGASVGDCVFFAAGEPQPARALLGAARLEIGKRCGLIDLRTAFTCGKARQDRFLRTRTHMAAHGDFDTIRNCFW